MRLVKGTIGSIKRDLLDTSALVALSDRRDKNHEKAVVHSQKGYK
jgi:predicted nucleic acid-binding protein